MAIHVGNRVRSYDFQNVRDCFVEGVVVAIERHEGCKRYKIQVERKVWSGEEVEDPYRGFVFPPVNGTQRLFGGECDGVELVA